MTNPITLPRCFDPQAFDRCLQCGSIMRGVFEESDHANVCDVCRGHLRDLDIAAASSRLAALKVPPRLKAEVDGILSLLDSALFGRMDPDSEIQASIDRMEALVEAGIQTPTIVATVERKRLALRARAAREVLVELKDDAAEVGR